MCQASLFGGMLCLPLMPSPCEVHMTRKTSFKGAFTMCRLKQGTSRVPPPRPLQTPRASSSSQRKILLPYKGQGWQDLPPPPPPSHEHPYCVQSMKPGPRGTHWLPLSSAGG